MLRSEPAPRARVLVVDDSAFMRRLVSDVIAEDAAFEVVGTARDGMHAMQQVAALNPDLVTLDIDMPGQDGLATLQQIMTTAPRPVIMLSAGGADGGVEATLRALELGAVEFVRKPSGTISLDLDGVRDQLHDALRAAVCTNRSLLATEGAVAAQRATPIRVAALSAAPHRSSPTVGVVRRHEFANAPATRLICIAASTGGPAALSHVVPALPRFEHAAVCIVQHMPSGFTTSLARRLDERSRLTVREASHGEPVLAGHAYVAPGGMHLRVNRVHGALTCLLDDAPTLWGVRPAADHLFRSAADAVGDGCIGVVLTGMGCDGAEGLFAIRHAGGSGLVQDVASSVIPGMPNAALRHAGADHIVALPALAELVTALALAAPQPRMPRAI